MLLYLAKVLWSGIVQVGQEPEDMPGAYGRPRPEGRGGSRG